MTPEQVIALLALIADLRLSVTRLADENAGLRHRLDLATGQAKADDDTLAEFARQMG